MKRIDEAIIEGVAQRMLCGKANQVGCIFWLKNKAGFRDKQPDEVAAECDDWLKRVAAFQAIPQAPAAAVPAADSDAAELLLFESGEPAADLAAEG
jgi:hypothetical protein